MLLPSVFRGTLGTGAVAAFGQAAHTGSVSVTERRAQFVPEMVHTHEYSGSIHTGSLNP